MPYPFFLPPEFYAALGGAMPQRRQSTLPIGVPPAQAEKRERESVWQRFKRGITSPEAAMVAASIGQRLAQPRQLGETGLMAATQALVQGYNTLAAAQWNKYLQQLEEQRRKMEEAKTRADIERTTAEAARARAQVEDIPRRTALQERRIAGEEKYRERQLALQEQRLKLEAGRAERLLQLDAERLRIERDKLARQIEKDRQDLALEQRKLDALIKANADRAEIDRQRLEVERRKFDLMWAEMQHKLAEAKENDTPANKLYRDLLKSAMQYSLTKEDLDEKVQMVDQLVDRYEKYVEGSGQQQQPQGYERIQPEPGYDEAIRAPDGTVYLRKGNQWFKVVK